MRNIIISVNDMFMMSVDVMYWHRHGLALLYPDLEK